MVNFENKINVKIVKWVFSFFIALAAIYGMYRLGKDIYWKFYQEVSLAIDSQFHFIQEKNQTLPYVSNDYISNWGAFGDFIGGTLNPILTFISICLILYTVYQNKKSLDINSDELKLSREAQQSTAFAQNEIQKLQSLQYFENTFLALQSKLKEIEDQMNEVEENNIDHKAYVLFSSNSNKDSCELDIKIRLRKIKSDVLYKKYSSIFILILNMIENRIYENEFLSEKEKDRLIKEYIEFLLLNVSRELMQMMIFTFSFNKKNLELIKKYNIVKYSEYSLNVADKRIYTMNILYLSSLYLFPKDNYILLLKNEIIRNIISMRERVTLEKYLYNIFKEKYQDKSICFSFDLNGIHYEYELRFYFEDKAIKIVNKEGIVIVTTKFKEMYIRYMGIGIHTGKNILFLNPFVKEYLKIDLKSNVKNLQFDLEENPL